MSLHYNYQSNENHPGALSETPKSESYYTKFVEQVIEPGPLHLTITIQMFFLSFKPDGKTIDYHKDTYYKKYKELKAVRTPW